MMKLYALKVAEHEVSSWEREYEKERKGVSPYVKLGVEIAKLEKELGAV